MCICLNVYCLTVVCHPHHPLTHYTLYTTHKTIPIIPILHILHTIYIYIHYLYYTTHSHTLYTLILYTLYTLHRKWTPEMIAEAKTRLSTLNKADELRQATEAALNELEGYIYKVRSLHTRTHIYIHTHIYKHTHIHTQTHTQPPPTPTHSNRILHNRIFCIGEEHYL
jgi:hypothetical protein